VIATDGMVILSGNVHSWAERQEAERAVWAAPGVTEVKDRLTIVKWIEQDDGYRCRSRAADRRRKGEGR
jgi:hypothetical protein